MVFCRIAGRRGLISVAWLRCSVRAVLDIPKYYLRSVLPRALPCSLLTPLVAIAG